MKRYWALVLCAVAAMGCEDYAEFVNPSYAPIGIQPGTRLSPKMLLADDGTIFPSATTWKDLEFGECEFRTAADGMYRCLPVATTQNSMLFIDTGCTQPAYYHPVNTCSLPTLNILVQKPALDKCNKEGVWSVFTTKTTINKGTLFRQNEQNCVAYIEVDGPDTGYIVLFDEEIPASEFVSAWR